jgi:hypothetical protein
VIARCNALGRRGASWGFYMTTPNFLAAVRTRFQIALSTLLIAGLCGGCQTNRPEIHFVVPVGFRGYIRIIPNADDGIVPERNGQKWTFVIPKSGMLKVKGPDPFDTWHNETAAFADGTSLPPPLPPQPPLKEGVSNELVRLWDIGGDQEGIWMYVGTEDELERALANTRPQPGVRVDGRGEDNPLAMTNSAGNSASPSDGNGALGRTSRSKTANSLGSLRRPVSESRSRCCHSATSHRRHVNDKVQSALRPGSSLAFAR